MLEKKKKIDVCTLKSQAVKSERQAKDTIHFRYLEKHKNARNFPKSESRKPYNC